MISRGTFAPGIGTDVDAMAAEIVLGELISNAVRYAPGRTHVQAEFDERGVTIAVQDSGKGFIAAVGAGLGRLAQRVRPRPGHRLAAG